LLEFFNPEILLKMDSIMSPKKDNKIIIIIKINPVIKSNISNI